MITYESERNDGGLLHFKLASDDAGSIGHLFLFFKLDILSDVYFFSKNKERLIFNFISFRKKIKNCTIENYFY